MRNTIIKDLTVKAHFERAKPPAEGNLMLRLDMLIAKNQNLLLYEDIDNLIKESRSMSFDRSTLVIATPNLSDKGCTFSGIDLASSAFLHGKSDAAFKLP